MRVKVCVSKDLARLLELFGTEWAIFNSQQDVDAEMGNSWYKSFIRELVGIDNSDFFITIDFPNSILSLNESINGFKRKPLRRLPFKIGSEMENLRKTVMREFFGISEEQSAA